MKVSHFISFLCGFTRMSRIVPKLVEIVGFESGCKEDIMSLEII